MPERADTKIWAVMSSLPQCRALGSFGFEQPTSADVFHYHLVRSLSYFLVLDVTALSCSSDLAFNGGGDGVCVYPGSSPGC